MPDYKEMYLHLARETEKAVRILIEAQRECEEMYISAAQTAHDSGAVEQRKS